MLYFHKVWELDQDFHKGDKLDIYSDGFGGLFVEKHVSPEEKERIRKKKRLVALKDEMKALEKELK